MQAAGIIRTRTPPRNSTCPLDLPIHRLRMSALVSLLPRAPCHTIRSMEHATVDERLPVRLTRALAPRDEVRLLSRYFDFLPQLDKMDAARRFATGKDLP